MSNSDVSLISTKSSKLYSGTYDIRYSSTSLILLNNKLREEVERLRHSDRSGTKTPRPVMDPGRHSRVSSAFSLTRHMHCCDSTTPKPEYAPSPSVQWLKSVTPTRFLEKHSVNQKRHRNCFPLPEKTFILDTSLPVLIQPEQQGGILSPYADLKAKKKKWSVSAILRSNVSLNTFLYIQAWTTRPGLQIMIWTFTLFFSKRTRSYTKRVRVDT